ncbi:aminoacetone oxidase family FAD-binding enzyme [candidate division KSB3 bacterium]|uniref:Aminoacetone oxidase family FAD-binding enzyme n=1 Tax=candidate division KSB3 bacterium TaxID=2044937 RepID=A0A2G6E6U0_9BACT|nr:MAG: aminoacetone oxidase family FAD-binding enzyme [candidate division KSB3 bacterium]PIE30236.1 MAG: aminoacetone oxidase family FAD-binding enzyme [candidate division KSB3 bacterium]
MKHTQYDVIIIGAGPAGLIAAIESVVPSRRILILDKMSKPALKLRLSGKGRCNITNAADLKEFIGHFGQNGHFLRPAFGKFFHKDLLRYFEELGLRFKCEEKGRYFPQSDAAEDIVTALTGKIEDLGIPLKTHCEVLDIAHSAGQGFRITIRRTGPTDSSTEELLHAVTILLATGGKSYPKTGSNGTGYRLASMLGHTITPVFPSLIPLETKGGIAKRLQGVCLRNITVSLWHKDKKLDERTDGEMLFTHFGVSGPAVLSLSRRAVECLNAQQQIDLSLDLIPGLDHAALDRQLLQDIRQHGTQHIKALLKRLLPQKMAAVFSELLEIPEQKTLSELSAKDRQRLRMLLKEFRLHIVGHRPFDEAIVTAGGIAIKDIDPKTMQSKRVKGLYFAGEIIDIDADTGGFNLQAAFSTGWLAGRSIAAQCPLETREHQTSHQ